MIEKLAMKNFKSIKDLEIDCGRVNLFIGEPNTGKSNILEAIGLLSWCGHLNTNLGEYDEKDVIGNIKLLTRKDDDGESVIRRTI
ncbi:AAA family ATPase [bacterium]|nr:AAA family ATPase [bacterium]